MQKARGVIQTQRVYEIAAGRTARGKELLQIAQRDPCLQQVAHLWVWASGTKLARIRPCANSSASHIASLTSVLRPGTFFTCAAFANTNANSPSSKMCHTGFQYTPVASIPTCVQSFAANHSDKRKRSAVVVWKVRTSVVTFPSA